MRFRRVPVQIADEVPERSGNHKILKSSKLLGITRGFFFSLALSLSLYTIHIYIYVYMYTYFVPHLEIGMKKLKAI